METGDKAARMVGIGPITDRTVSQRMTRSGSYEEAKILAAKDFLKDNLEYEDWELDDLEIVGTKMAAKVETLYLAFSSQ